MNKRPNYNNFPYVNIYNEGLSNVITTRFGEIFTAWKHSVINFKPTWGLSQLRYSILSGSGTTIREIGGEFELSTGTNNIELK